MDFWDRIETVAADNDVLEHPFYVRWSNGELTREELAAYCGQYRHAVVALAAASRNAAPAADGELREHLEDHAAEETAHVELWDRFVAATGGDAAADADARDRACAAAWAGAGRDPARDAGRAVRDRVGAAADRAVKQQGLVDLYGFEQGPATDYFEIHATLDHEHAAVAPRVPRAGARAGADQDELIAAAREVLTANWTLLDGVERLNGVSLAPEE